jgi:hypothetical protein
MCFTLIFAANTIVLHHIAFQTEDKLSEQKVAYKLMESK